MISKLSLFIGFLTSTIASAGVISGGGGGLVSPEPTTQYAVEKAAEDYTGRILIPFFRRQEILYRGLTQAEKLNSPFRKIFESQNSIYSLIRDTAIEVRSNGPCLDSSGKSFDGSIFAQAPAVICLSSYTMAPKLSHYNVEVETVALAAHEYSHLLGCTEAEATKIQVAALALSAVDFFEVSRQITKGQVSFHSYDYLPSFKPSSFLKFYAYLNGEQTSLSKVERESIRTRLLTIFENLKTERPLLWFVPKEVLLRWGAIYAKYDLAANYLCTQDVSITVQERESCQAKDRQAFSSSSQIGFDEYLSFVKTDSNCLNLAGLCFEGYSFTNSKLQRVRTEQEAKRTLREVDAYLKELQSFFDELGSCGSSVLNPEKLNCKLEKSEVTQPANYKLVGTYDEVHKIECDGVWDWPHLRNTSCTIVDGPGVSQSPPGRYVFKIRETSSPVFEWHCSGSSLDRLHCIQPL